MKRINKSLVVRFSVFGFLFIILSQVFFINTAHALFPADRTAKRGYFSNHYFDWNSTQPRDVLPKIGSAQAVSACSGSNNGDGRAIPGCINTVTELISLLKGYNTNSCSSADLDCRQKRTGSAFIAYTMLGIGSGIPTTRTVTTGQWNDLTARLNSSTIDWTSNVSGDQNTIWRRDYSNGNVDDVVWYNQSKTEPGIAIYDSSGNIAYRILRGCANPLGSLVGVPVVVEGSWSIGASIERTTAPYYVKPNDTTKWKYWVKNTGSSSTTKPVKYGPVASTVYGGSPGTSYLSSATRTAGLGAGKTSPIHEETFVIPAGAKSGDKFCRHTRAEPKSSASNGVTHSAQVCVEVKSDEQPHSEWYATSKIAINKTTAKPLDTVTWTHKVKNGGPDKNDKEINYGYNTSTTILGGLVKGLGEKYKGSISVNTAVSSSERTFTTTIQIPYGSHDGQKICRYTYAEPKSHLSGTQIKSAERCVTVDNKPWALEVLSTAQVKEHSGGSWRDNNSAGRDVEPNDEIRWKHTVKNRGDSQVDTNQTIKYRYKNHKSDFDRMFNGSTLKNTLGPEKTQSSPVAKGASFSNTPWHSLLSSSNAFIIGQDDVGKSFCRSTRATPKSHIDFDVIESAYACVEVKYNYDLEPFVDSNIEETVTATGNQHKIKTSVKNNGPTKSRPNVTWKLTRFMKEMAPDTFFSPLPSLLESTNDPCVQYAAEGGICEAVDSGDQEFPKGMSPKTLTDTEDYKIGSKICYVMSVNPYKEGGAWRHSKPVCISIGKSPKVQVWGGDVWSKKDIKMQTTTYANKTYGSWAEYGLFSPGSIIDMASNSIFADNSDIIGPAGYSPLSFTNEDVDDIGRYTMVSSEPMDISANYPINSAIGLAGGGVYDLSNPTDFPSGKSVYTVTLGGPISLFGDVPEGRTIIINAPNKTVKITGSITYPSSIISSIDKIPQLLIIAKNIEISPSVQNIDAWLVAVKDKTNLGTTGVIDTCFDKEIKNIRIGDDCDNQLRINGPVIANKLLLKRTYGSDTVPTPDNLGVPAEIINFRADAYLWAAAQSSKSNTIRTVYSVEQPPRF